jgi:hypothetical protein
MDMFDSKSSLKNSYPFRIDSNKRLPNDIPDVKELQVSSLSSNELKNS